MRHGANRPQDLHLFEEHWPVGIGGAAPFRSECPPDKKVKVADLFAFRRGRGDLHVSCVALGLALIFLAFFWTETGWDTRKLPDDLGGYLAHQVGLAEIEGRVTRLGRILKQSWIAPMLCLLLLVPTALWNARASLRVHRWRQRFGQPTAAAYEFEHYRAALEYVAYFVAYTLLVPILGYLVATVLLGCYLTWRLGYRTWAWMGIGLASSLAIVIVFRSLLQIKTPVSIWLYDLLPSGPRAFMLTYF